MQRQVTHVRRSLRRRHRNILKAILKMQDLLHQAQNTHELVEQADLIKCSLYSFSDREKEQKEKAQKIDEMKKLYTKAKRLARGISKIEEELERLHEREREVSRDLQRLDEGEDVVVPLQQSRQKKIVSQPYRNFRASSGEKIIVGKDAKSNQYISTHLAKGDDLWFHADQVAGSHVIIRSAEAPAPQAIEEAALLAAYFSKARANNAQVSVIIAKGSDVYRKKGMATGQVCLRTYKLTQVVLDKEKIAEIFNRRI